MERFIRVKIVKDPGQTWRDKRSKLGADSVRGAAESSSDRTQRWCQEKI
jgi:hypothetical protein